MDFLSILPGSILLGIVGATDSAVVVLANQKQFASRWFLLKWAIVACFLHFILKALAGSLNGLSALLFIDIFALIVTVQVTRISFRELKHAKDSFHGNANENFAVHPIRENSLQTWLPLAAVCALDAYPLGHFKELLTHEAFGPKLIAGYVLSSISVGTITYLAGLLAKRLEQGIKNPKDAFICLTRTMHALVCLTMVMVLSLDLSLISLGTIIPALAGKSALNITIILVAGLTSCLILSWTYGEMIKVAWARHAQRRTNTIPFSGS